jgi:hypothetical protein
MITDEDLIDFEFADFWDDESKEDAVIESDAVIEPDYIKRHISRISHYGDNSGVAVGISSRYVRQPEPKRFSDTKAAASGRQLCSRLDRTRRGRMLWVRDGFS